MLKVSGLRRVERRVAYSCQRRSQTREDTDEQSLTLEDDAREVGRRNTSSTRMKGVEFRRRVRVDCRATSDCEAEVRWPESAPPPPLNWVQVACSLHGADL